MPLCVDEVVTHSPGPWRVVDIEDAIYICANDARSTVVCHMNMRIAQVLANLWTEMDAWAREIAND